MNHYCESSHLPKDHHLDFGQCEAVNAGLFGDDPCTCPLYVKDSDD